MPARHLRSPGSRSSRAAGSPRHHRAGQRRTHRGGGVKLAAVLDTPVAIVIWRRPETTRRVLRGVARANPRRLMVIADGPTTPADEAVCLATRATVEEFDWEGEVLRNFVEEDIGLQRRVVSGFDWVFEHCEEAILLEDDCL